VQGHCLLIELKLCKEITCIGGKTGGWEKTGVAAAPSFLLEPRLQDCDDLKCHIMTCSPLVSKRTDTIGVKTVLCIQRTELSHEYYYELLVSIQLLTVDGLPVVIPLYPHCNLRYSALVMYPTATRYATASACVYIAVCNKFLLLHLLCLVSDHLLYSTLTAIFPAMFN